MAIGAESVDRSSLWCIYREIQELLRFHPDIRIQKVDCECNKVAHVLAQLGKSGFNGSLRDSVPTCALELITNDCNSLYEHFVITGQQVSYALFSLPGYIKGLEGF
jgi:hypothetical protein